MTDEQTAGVRRYQTLDGLRGIAAMAVVLHHGYHWFPVRPHLANTSVDLFFLLSGFVIASAYEKRLDSGMTIRQFMAIRMIRLYPLYLVGMLIMIGSLVVSLISHGGVTAFHLAFWKAVPFAALMLPSPGFGVMGNVYPLDPPAWSLLYEICINLIFALTYRSWTPSRIIVFVAIVGIVILTHPEMLWGGWGHENFFDGIARVCFFYPLGVFLFRIEKSIPVFNWLRTWHCLVLFVAIASFFLEPFTTIFMLLACPLLVALAVTVEPSGNAAMLCDKVGKWSYAIYAIHFPIIGMILAVQTKLGTRFNAWILGAILFTGLIILAELLDRFYDTPIRRRLTAMVRARR